jgi:DNA-nicking Smr family endonuclease
MAGPNEADLEMIALWRRVIADVEPLKGRPPLLPLPATARETTGRDAAAGSPHRPAAPGAARRDVATSARPAALLQPGEAAGLDKRTLQRLRRGLIRPEGQIDLHCLSQADAHQALSRFILAARRAQRRCVLVITGKGLRSGGEMGILKMNVPRWLNEAPLRPLVLAFAFAQPSDGGDGALYVLLRRSRS